MQQTAQTLLNELQDELDDAMRARVARATALYASERHGAALQALFEGLLIARRRGSGPLQAFIYLLMGTVYRHWLREIALKHFRDGLEVARAADFAPGEAVARRAIAALEGGG